MPVTLQRTSIWCVASVFPVTFLDGFDLTIVGVALPKIADVLHSNRPPSAWH